MKSIKYLFSVVLLCATMCIFAGTDNEPPLSKKEKIKTKESEVAARNQVLYRQAKKLIASLDTPQPQSKFIMYDGVGSPYILTGSGIHYIKEEEQSLNLE